ncbi:MAG TPA: zinc-binding alcohol dehydrogenase [Beijerinckiaceae bacterium]|jgi:threonine dehydrogenase-like Zn-dependent dehydrogenase|nr:zinc-binding alcohol dehydrogenase [Beijerinckiaceae bacterium]
MAVDSKSGNAQALWHVSPGLAQLRDAAVTSPGPDEALVKTLWSAISRGTERLISQGHVPASEYERMRAPLQEGAFPFPVKYGYCAVGTVEAGPADWIGRRVFALHPHQSRFVAPLPLLTPLPDGLDPRRAVLAANMETALNALWDSGAGPGDRIAVIGGGLVGLLVSFLCARLPGAEVHLIDVDESRRSLAQALGAQFSRPDTMSCADCDVVFHTSATASGLETAIELAGLEARVVELSWYGAGAIAAPLGGGFHSKRLQIVSSQVGQVSPSRRPRWTHGRRMAKALELLDDARLDQLITHEFAFTDLPRLLPGFLNSSDGIAAVVRY